MAGRPKQSKRDYAVTAVFEGFFGCGWFGWGQAAAPTGCALPAFGATALVRSLRTSADTTPRGPQSAAHT